MIKMRKAFLLPEGAVAAAGVEWDTGAARRDDRAAGPRICYEGKQGLRVLGGEARWLKRPMVGADGWLLGWQKICRTRLRGLSVDKEGYVVRAAGEGRLTPEEARRHGLAVEALVRARAALGDEVAVIDEPMGKREGPAFVNLRQVEADLERYAMWEARAGIEALFTLDGTRQEPAKEERKRQAKAKRAERQKEAENVRTGFVNRTTRRG